jgi:hypothetical protein
VRVGKAEERREDKKGRDEKNREGKERKKEGRKYIYKLTMSSAVLFIVANDYNSEILFTRLF